MTKSREEFHFNRNKLAEAIHAHSFGDFQGIENFIESEIRRNVMEALEQVVLYSDNLPVIHDEKWNEGRDDTVKNVKRAISEVKKKWEEIG